MLKDSKKKIKVLAWKSSLTKIGPSSRTYYNNTMLIGIFGHTVTQFTRVKTLVYNVRFIIILTYLIIIIIIMTY